MINHQGILKIHANSKLFASAGGFKGIGSGKVTFLEGGGGVKLCKDLCKTDLLPSLIQTSVEFCTLPVFEVKVRRKQLRYKNIYHNKLWKIIYL